MDNGQDIAATTVIAAAIKLTSVEAEDTKLLRDILPPSANAAAARAVAMAVRPHGRVALMGGVGMLGGPGLELSFRIRGS